MTAAWAGATAAPKKSRAITRPTNDQAELTNGTSRNTPRARKAGQTRYGRGGSPVARLCPQERQKQAPAPSGGHHGELKRRGAELAPENQAEEWAGQAREDREQERRRDIDPEGATNLRTEPRSDHLRLSGLTGAAGPDSWSSRSSPATIMSHLVAPASLPDDVRLTLRRTDDPGRLQSTA